MAKNTHKNSKEYNKKALKKYHKENFKRYSVAFRIEEFEEVEEFCKENNIPKNTFFRKVIIDYIKNHKMEN